MGEKRFSGVSFLMNLVFPPRCRCCQQLSGSKLLCEACATGLHEVGGNPCRFCGRDADRCRCDYGKNLLFERAVSAYYYEGTGRTLLQNFKFKGDRACYDQILSRRFLERTASAFSGVPFDYIVPVPMYEREKTGSTKRCTWPGPCREKWGFRAGRICCGKFKKHHRSICKKQRTVAKM